MYKLDLKDKKILYELDLNSRQSFNEISKKVGLSKDSIIYRINKLKKDKIIKKFHTIINVSKLGYISFRLYLKFQNTNLEKENEIIQFLKKEKIVTWIVSIDGKYDLGMWILTKSIKEMNLLWKKINENFINFIKEKKLTIFTKVSYFPRTYFLDINQNNLEYVFITEPEDQKLNDKEIELLKLLADNSRISVLELSKKLNLTTKTVTSKIKEFENNKVIVGYRTMFDLDKLNYQYFKLDINLYNVHKDKIDKFKTYVKFHKNIIYDNEVLGGEDLEIEIQVKTIQEFRKIINDIKKEFSDIIKSYDYMIFYKEHKFVFIPVPE